MAALNVQVLPRPLDPAARINYGLFSMSFEDRYLEKVGICVWSLEHHMCMQINVSHHYLSKTGILCLFCWNASGI